MCLNCSLSVKSTKIGMMTVFKALKKIGYGAIAKTTVKGHLKLKNGGHFEPEVKMTVSRKCLYINNLAKK